MKTEKKGKSNMSYIPLELLEIKTKVQLFWPNIFFAFTIAFSTTLVSSRQQQRLGLKYLEGVHAISVFALAGMAVRGCS